MPFLGQAIPLSFQLLDGDDSKFCRAIVKTPAGVEVVGSPVPLVARGNGSYSSDALAMPNVSYLDVVYQSFNDSGFSVVDPDHLLGGDTFSLEIPDTVIVDKLTLIENKLNGLSLGGGGVTTRVAQTLISEIIDDTRSLKALVKNDVAAASVDSSVETSASVLDQKIGVAIESCDIGEWP